MNELEGLTPAPRKVMTLFYLVDTSGSMQGGKIQSVNAALEETKALLDGISKSNDDAEIRIGVLSFNTQVHWLTPKPVNPEDYNAKLTAEGLTSLGAAYTELEKKLSRTEFLDTKAGAYPPVILLLSDGAPTDNAASGLEKLKHNNWFKRAIKVAFAIGNDAKKDVLAEFTGSMEAVIEAKNARELKNFIEHVSTITSEFQSRSSSVGADTDPVKAAEDAVKKAKDEEERNKATAGTATGGGSGAAGGNGASGGTGATGGSSDPWVGW